MSALIRAASYYARLGWRVHPCWWVLPDGNCACGAPGCTTANNRAGKHPIFGGWQNRATIDRTLIDRWWSRSPDANVAIATGSVSGIFVFDVDGPEGERTLVELERRHGPLPELYPMQWTGGGRGGWQAFFAYPEGRTISNSAGRLGPKLDTRGEGGYVLAAPNVTAEAYRWEVDRAPGVLPPEPAPDWLVDLLDPPPAERPAYTADHHEHDGDRYVLRALEAELALIASAPDGRRNEQLNESAFNLFRFVLEDRLDASAIVHGLEEAGRHAGLTEKEIAATISSAAKARGLSS
jgi:hypothetical protein